MIKHIAGAEKTLPLERLPSHGFWSLPKKTKYIWLDIINSQTIQYPIINELTFNKLFALLRGNYLHTCVVNRYSMKWYFLLLLLQPFTFSNARHMVLWWYNVIYELLVIFNRSFLLIRNTYILEATVPKIGSLLCYSIYINIIKCERICAWQAII